METNHGLLPCQKKKKELNNLDILQVHIPLWRPHLSPHVSHVHQDMWSWLRHRRLLSSCVFSGHSGGGGDFCSEVDNIKMPFRAPRLNLLAPLSCLVFAVCVWFSRQRPDSLQQKGTLANGINQLLFLKASFCLQREQEGGSRRKNQSGLRQHCCCCCCCCMVKHRGAPTVRYSLYIFTQGQIKIMWASPEGERECAVLVSRARGLQQPIICWSWPQHTSAPFKSGTMGPIRAFTGTTCYLAPSVGQMLLLFCFFLSSASGSQLSSMEGTQTLACVFLHQTRPWKLLFIRRSPLVWVEQVCLP